jgi:hypothetical protein
MVFKMWRAKSNLWGHLPSVVYLCSNCIGEPSQKINNEWSNHCINLAGLDIDKNDFTKLNLEDQIDIVYRTHVYHESPKEQLKIWREIAKKFVNQFSENHFTCDLEWLY